MKHIGIFLATSRVLFGYLTLPYSVRAYHCHVLLADKKNKKLSRASQCLCIFLYLHVSVIPHVILFHLF